jgi:TRAP-type C4-dicarboxylate transport system permease small subunit
VSQTPEEIEADIERQREQLAHTVDVLGTKLDEKKAQATKGLAVAAAVVAVGAVAYVAWRHWH